VDESRPQSDSWQVAQRIFTEARELQEAEREAFVRRECGGDADLLAEVRALLALEGQAEAFFDHLAARIAGSEKGGPSLAGRTVGRFEVTESIGRGGMGEVYRARDLRLGREVALKVLPTHLATDESHVARFRQEARMVAALNHPNIARIHDVEEIDSLIVLVLELVEGVSLRERLDRGGLRLDEALDIGKQVAEALEAAHDVGIVHRDLKPSNIVVTREGKPFILDFGIAKSLERLRRGAVSQGHPLRATADETTTGMVVGTASYMSPEQARAQPVDERSDVWAFGALLYEMLTGRKAFAGEGLSQIIGGVLESEPDWGALPEDTPAPIRQLLGRCLERDVRRRLQAIGEARITLEAMLWAEGPHPAPPAQVGQGRALDSTPALETAGRARPLPSGVRKGGRRRWAWAATGLPLVAVVVVMMTRAGAPTSSAELLAIGEIADYLGVDGPRSAAALSDMLATNLARVDGVGVLSAARMLEVAPRDLPRAGSLAAAARRAGATAVIEGGLHRASTGGYRLDLRIVRLEGGEVLAAFALEGPDLFTLADSGTSRIASHLGGRAPSGSIREVTTSSELAYTLYREGLRLHFAGDREGAEAMLGAALREDPDFAMAAYWGSIIATDRDYGRSLTLLARADTLAEKAPDRERWLIRARVAGIGLESRLRAYADSLVQRYPEEPDGWEILARALVSDGAYAEALPVLRRVLAEIGADEPPDAAVCRTCETYALLASAYANLDSTEARRRAAEAWTETYPGVPAAWRLLALTLGAEGAHDAADVARQAAFRLDGAFEVDRRLRVNLAMARGDLAAAAAAARSEGEGAAPDWWLTSYVERARGRWEEAMDAALRARASGEGEAVPPGSVHPAALSQAVTLRMSGSPREAAALYDSLATWRHEAAPPPLTARQRAWMLLQRADALASAGEVSELPDLVDEIERLGTGSGHVRDRRMHWHVRGLSLLAGGDTAAALDAFRRSIFSLSQGYTRTNQAWAEVLIARGEADAAIPLLQSALKGPIEGSTFYTNPADSHRLLAEAWSRMPGAQAADSARAHREWGR
jgi:tetratricopeptide (TPR) repeat protein/predicted Ser/Thr protein kinase